MKFNINDNVKVKLTEIGLAELERQHNKLREIYPSMVRYKGQDVDNRGYTSFQMHELMYYFGHMTYNGSQIPFEMDIIIDDDAKGLNFNWEKHNSNGWVVFRGSGLGKTLITKVSTKEAAIAVCKALNEDGIQ